MARKDLLKGLMDPDSANSPPAPSPDGRRVDPARPRYATGAIGAVSESIAALRNRAVVELDPNLIEAGGLNDRLEHDEADHKRLMASIKEYGQQVPILVRPSPDNADRYQIVYGRRRVLALRDLGLTAKAMIRDLDDRAVVMAQGQENAARRDLSFIEKCNFARQMRDANYDRKAICDALNVDKTLISRMISVSDRVPVEIIEAIGAAPGIGRDRWLHFSNLFEASDYDAAELVPLIHALARSPASDARFESALDRLEASEPSKPRPKAKPPRRTVEKVVGESGVQIGKITRREDKTTIDLPRFGPDGFDDWLASNLSEIHRKWVKGSTGE